MPSYMTTAIASVILYCFYFIILLYYVYIKNKCYIHDKDLNPEEKLQAIEAEVQQTLYSEEEYDEAVYGK